MVHDIAVPTLQHIGPVWVSNTLKMPVRLPIFFFRPLEDWPKIVTSPLVNISWIQCLRIWRHTDGWTDYEFWRLQQILNIDEYIYIYILNIESNTPSALQDVALCSKLLSRFSWPCFQDLRAAVLQVVGAVRLWVQAVGWGSLASVNGSRRSKSQILGHFLDHSGAFSFGYPILTHYFTDVQFWPMLYNALHPLNTFVASMLSICRSPGLRLGRLASCCGSEDETLTLKDLGLPPATRCAAGCTSVANRFHLQPGSLCRTSKSAWTLILDDSASASTRLGTQDWRILWPLFKLPCEEFFGASKILEDHSS